MKTGLLKRIPRDLKRSWGRYLALMILIMASMYIVVSVVGMTETTIQGTEVKTEANRIQDGQFTTFEMLSVQQEKEITDMGVELERLFYVDVISGEDTLRIGRVRKTIDLIDLDEGRLPERDNEIVLMNLYCSRNGITVGNTVAFSGRTYTVCGIGSVPDYNLPLKAMSDMTSNPDRFGVAFLSDEGYEDLISSDDAGSEVYVYAYRLNGIAAEELKDLLKSYDYDYEDTDNVFLREMIDDGLQDRYEFEDALEELGDGIDELIDGSGELYDGAGELYDGITELYDDVPDLIDGINALNDGADDLETGIRSFATGVGSAADGAAALSQGAAALAGGTVELQSGASEYGEGVTAFSDTVTVMTASEDPYMAGVAAGLSGPASDLSGGFAGISEGITQAAEGASGVNSGAAELSSGMAGLRTGADSLVSGADTLHDGTQELADGATELSDGIDELYDGSGELLDGAEELTDGVREFADGFEEFREETEDFLDEAYEVDISLLEEFTENKDNPRIASDAASDVYMKKTMGLFAGAVILALIAYVISVFTGNQIREESSVIGTLFALGIRKSEIAVHYMILPVMLTFVSGVAGMAMGFSRFGVTFQMKDIYDYYSVPVFADIMPLYLIIYCCVVPPLISAVVNFLVINGKLNSTALSLMRNEDRSRIRGEGPVREKKGFISDFRSRQIRRERRSLAAVVVGMIISLILLLLGVSCFVLCDNVKEHNIRDASCEYTYILKYPPLEVPQGAEECYARSLKYTYLGYTLDVNLYGITENSRFFDAHPSGHTNRVIIGNGVATKYGLSEGDMIVLTDSSEDRNYAFTIEGVTDYSIGLTVFMDIDSARDLFGAGDDEYNVLFSNVPLDIEEGRILSLTTAEEIKDTAGIFVDQMMSLVVIMVAISCLIFITVMYLMINVMIQRASTSIALVKIFGYRSGELRRVFMDGNLAVVAICALIGIPSCKFLVDRIYPAFIANTAMENDITYPWWLWILLYIAVMAVYLIISSILTGKIKRIEPTEVLKNRE